MAVEQDNSISVTRLPSGRFKVMIGDTVLILTRLQADTLKTKLSVSLATDWAMGSEGAKANET